MFCVLLYNGYNKGAYTLINASGSCCLSEHSTMKTKKSQAPHRHLQDWHSTYWQKLGVIIRLRACGEIVFHRFHSFPIGESDDYSLIVFHRFISIRSVCKGLWNSSCGKLFETCGKLFVVHNTSLYTALRIRLRYA